MLNKIIDGKVISKAVREELKIRIEKLTENGIIPGLSVILIGDDPASATYVKNKERASRKLGINSEVIRLPADIDSGTVENLIDDINANDDIHGFLLQLPIPEHLDTSALINRMSPLKDVDGFHPANLGLLCEGNPRFLPCTPAGINEMFRHQGIKLKGKHIVIVGRSRIVGRPLSILLSTKGIDATVTLCHSRTEDIAEFSRAADILVAAIGIPHFFNAEMISEGCIVIDVGTNKLDDKLVGDVDFDDVFDKVGAITPVPGGVGRMTVTMLMANTVLSAERFSVGK